MLLAELDPPAIAFIILTSVYAISSIVILYLSHRANKIAKQTIIEMEQERIIENRPYVNFGVEVTKHLLFKFTLENLGKTTAHNVKLKFSTDLKAFEYRNEGETKIAMLSELAICDEIYYITPGRRYNEIVNSFAPFFWKLNNNQAHLLGVLEYFDEDENRYTENLDIDLGTYFDRRNLVSVKSIDETISSINNSVNTIIRLIKK